MHSIDKLKVDKRFKSVKSVYEKARVIFTENYLFNHSLYGEKPSEERIQDFAMLAAYIKTAQIKNLETCRFSWKKKYMFPSKQVGTLKELIGTYRYGWEILHDLGLYDPESEEEFIK
jgi:hypothetical protein